MTRTDINTTPAGSFTATYVPVGTYPPQSPTNDTYPSFDGRNNVIVETQRSRQNDNDCFHRKLTNVVYRYPITHFHSLNGEASPNYWRISYDWPHYSFDYASTHNNHNMGRDGLNGLDLYTSDPLNTYAFAPFVERALAYMLPGIKPAVSIVNDIIELRDFKRLPKMIDRVSQYYYSLPSWLKTITKKNKGRATLRELFRTSSEAYLNNDFAVAPLIRSIIDCSLAISDLRRKLKGLTDNAERIQYAHYSELATPPTLPSQVNVNCPVGGFYTCNHSRIISYEREPRLRASMKYSYKILTPKEYQMRTAFLDTIGLQLNPQIIWNAIPWSFVVDWVLNVGSVLGQFKMNNLDIRTDIHRFCISYSLKRIVECYVNNAIFSALPSGTKLSRRSEVDVYSRRAIEPDLTRHLALSGLNLKEFSYIGALLGARV